MTGYQIEIRCKDGTLVVTGFTEADEFGNALPDGVWTINGREDDRITAINITRRELSGQYVAEAQHSRVQSHYTPRLSGETEYERVKRVLMMYGFDEERATQFAERGVSRHAVWRGGNPEPERPHRQHVDVALPESIDDFLDHPETGFTRTRPFPNDLPPVGEGMVRKPLPEPDAERLREKGLGYVGDMVDIPQPDGTRYPDESDPRNPVNWVGHQTSNQSLEVPIRRRSPEEVHKRLDASGMPPELIEELTKDGTLPSRESIERNQIPLDPEMRNTLDGN